MIRRTAASARHYPLPLLVLTGLVFGLGIQFGLGRSAVGNDILLFTLVIGGLPVIVGTLRKGAHGNFATDIVASLAIVGAAVTGEYLAGCVIVLMQTGGEALDDYAVRRASSSLEALLARAPRVAHLRRGDTLVDVPAEDVTIGDEVVVRPGELVPVDGVVLLGLASVDESALTGEPVPVSAGPGKELMSGSVCLDGALHLSATRGSAESQYEQIVQLVRTAQADRAPLGRLADRYAVVFTPLTLLMCGAAYLLSGSPQAMVAVLVVATPCPLILATPVAIVSGINRAARLGIIVKGGSAIERVGQASAVVFDKTGTLTQGTPAVDRVVALDGIPQAEILRLAAGLEQFSTHPMARALVAAGQHQDGALPLPHDVTEVAGQGLSGIVDNHHVDVGSMAYAAGHGLATEPVLAGARTMASAQDDSVAVIGIDGRAAGLVVYADPIRTSVSALLKRLKTLDVRETAMLTGDDEATAQAVASTIGITSVRARLLPAQKVEAIRGMERTHGTVVMVGDGVNDAPALAAATVGIALGAHGAAISAEAADIVITTDDLGRVGEAVAIGQHTLRIAKQSIWIGLGVSGSLMVVAAFGYIPPTLGAMLQEVLDVGVILNALRAR